MEQKYKEHAKIDSDSSAFVLDLSLAAFTTQGVLIKQVLCHLVVVGIHAGKVGDVVTKLLDGLHLLIQIVALQEVTQLFRKQEGRANHQWWFKVQV